MRLLLCLPSPAPFSTVIDYLNQHGSAMLPKQTEDVQYLYSTRFLQHDVDVWRHSSRRRGPAGRHTGAATARVRSSPDGAPHPAM
jgi:hypothetical protein